MALEHTERTPEVMIEHCPRDLAAEKLLDLFFRIHYVVGMKVEDTLRTNDILTGTRSPCCGQFARKALKACRCAANISRTQ